MPYLGNDLQVAQPSYRNIDDISGSFNSSTTSFPLLVSGSAPVPFPINSNQCLISVAGVVQRPDDSGTEGFRISSGNIIFSSAPSTGADFFGVILAGADYVNVGANFPSGSAAVPSITFDSDLDTGIYNSAANQVSITTAGTERLRIDSAGQIESVSLGSASAPAFSFTTDPNTGIYSPGADQVAISTNGSGRLFVDSSGRALVGTSSSTGDYLLEVQGRVGTSAGGAEVRLSRGETAAQIGGNGSMLGRIWFTSGSDNGQGAQISAHADATWASNDYPTRLVFATTADSASSPTERMRITSAGLVGIGNTNPQRKLVVSEGGAQGFEFFPGDGGGGNTLNHYNRSTSAFINITTNADQHIWARADGEKARLDSSGRLLVGTSSTSSSSTAIFQGNSASSTADGIIRLARGTTSPANGDVLGTIIFTDSGHGDAAYFYAQRDGGTWNTSTSRPSRLVFSTTADGAASPTERMRINSAGYVKASNTGTYLSATDAYHEFIAGASGNDLVLFRHTATSNPYGLEIQFSGAAPNNATSWFLYCQDTGGQRAAILSNGGLRNFQANNVNLSDRNTKKDISPAADTWDCIKEWEIVNYRYKDQPDDADLNLGVIAQQVAESCPEVITVFQEAKDDQPEKLGIKEQQMYWMAIKALQEAQVRIEALETEVAALKAQ